MGLRRKLEEGTYFKPMLVADGTEADLDKEGWVATIKMDGTRAIAQRSSEGLLLYGRRGLTYNETVTEVFEDLSKYLFG